MGASEFSSPTRRSAPDCRAGLPMASRSLFYAFSTGPEKPKLYTVSADGGTPREMIPENSPEEWDATWSPDGSKIAFGSGQLILPEPSEFRLKDKPNFDVA